MCTPVDGGNDCWALGRVVGEEDIVYGQAIGIEADFHSNFQGLDIGRKTNKNGCLVKRWLASDQQ